MALMMALVVNFMRLVFVTCAQATSCRAVSVSMGVGVRMFFSAHSFLSNEHTGFRVSLHVCAWAHTAIHSHVYTRRAVLDASNNKNLPSDIEVHHEQKHRQIGQAAAR